MATRNGANWVGEQIDSIAAQRGEFELTVAACDDGSTDSTISILSSHAAASRLKIEWVQSNRPGGSAARNFFRLLDAADFHQYNYVSFADQDDIWEADKIQRAIDLLRTSGASGYSASVLAFWPGGKSTLLRQAKNSMLADYLFEGAGQGCSFVLTSELMQLLQLDLRQLREQVQTVHYHDWTLYALCRSHGNAWLFDDWPCLRYRQHGSNDTGARGSRSALLKRFQLIRSGWYADQVRRVAALCAEVEGSHSATARRLLNLMNADSGWSGRARLAIFVLRHGRRKWVDRLVLAWASLAGHLHSESSRD